MVKRCLSKAILTVYLALAACSPMALYEYECTKPNVIATESAPIQIQRGLKRYVKPDSDKIVYIIMDSHAISGVYGEENMPIQHRITSLMEYLAEERGVRMIGIEGYEGELDGREYLERIKEAMKKQIQEMPSDEELKDALKWVIAPCAPEILEPDKFYTFGVDDVKLQEEYDGCFERMKEISREMLEAGSNHEKLYKEILELDKRMEENKDERSRTAVRNFLKEMDRKGHKKGILVFGEEHMEEMKSEFEENCSYELFDPLMFIPKRGSVQE
jgi:hypothetical protein